MDQNKCPFCYSKNFQKKVTGILEETITCHNCHMDVNVDWVAWGFSESKPIYHKALNLIREKTLFAPSKNGKYRWCFYYDEEEKECSDKFKINLYTLLKDYPQTFFDALNRTLLNLAFRYPEFGEFFYVNDENFRLFYPAHGKREEAEGMLRMLAQMGYVTVQGIHSLASISAEGWKKIESLQKQQVEIKQGFVAMSFNPTTAEIREGFRQAISNAGYSMRAIDEKEHNNQIVPEIFYEIERSKFVVVDITYPNYGAYYEAGYAYGLGKEVIVCCSKEAFDNKDGKFERPHFDISQKSMVIWDDIEDLKARLTRRIQATVK